MIRRLGLAGLAFALLGGVALAEGPVTIGYLGLKDDIRYHPDIVYTRIEIAPGGNPIDGATMGVSDLKVVSDAVGQTVSLDHQEAPNAPALIAKVGEMVTAGVPSATPTSCTLLHRTG
jgi:hypothetical protein